MSFNIDKKTLKDFIESRDLWGQILAHLCGMNAEVASLGTSKHFDCPFPERHATSGGRKKFRLFRPGALYTGKAICSCGSWTDGFDLIQDVLNVSFMEALTIVNDHLGDPLDVKSKGAKGRSDIHRAERMRELSADHAKRIADAKAKTSIDDQRKAKRIVERWNEGLNILSAEASPFHLYLKNRAINPAVLNYIDTDALKFHPAFPYYDCNGRFAGKYPCLMAKYSSKDDFTFHRIYLTTEGTKFVADVDTSGKKMMAKPSSMDLSGGAIKLGDPSTLRVLGITEGVETALAVTAATNIACFATYSAELMKTFDVNSVRDDIDMLLIWADKDISLTGEKAAKALKERAWSAGIPCQIMMPKGAIPDGEKSWDWNDVLRFSGAKAFPKPDVSILRNVSANTQG